MTTNDHSPNRNDAPEQSELSERLWAVISFDKCEASNLTYDEASRKMSELEGQDVTGLCIVTNGSAEKVGGRIA